ncbi:hypothetical protein KBD75_00300 [Candidatus Woesebacteria bacterium]|nr:hypothetical protein [Candidatus Woesebacteria bacterium]
MYNKDTKNEAILLRKMGKSLLEISKTLNIAKSTCSLWLSNKKNKGLYGTMTKQEWMKFIQKKSVIALHKRSAKRQESREADAKSQIRNLKFPKEVRRSILATLYWAEGSKGIGVLNFANTDSRLCLIFITLLRDCYELDESKFRIRLHLHNYHNEEELKKYWSELLKIPLSQFNQTIWKREPTSGKRYRQNYHGICFVKYNSVDLQKRIMAYAHILGEKLTKNAPVA